MAGWFERNLGRLVGLLGPIIALFAPGSHTALLEEARQGARLKAELAKPPGERSHLLHGMRCDFHMLQLENHKEVASVHAAMASSFEKPTSRMCCDAAGWVRQRLAASYWARYDFERRCVRQIAEELAASLGGREPALVAQPTFALHLPQALRQLPPRMDMCSACVKLIEQADLDEQSHSLMAQHIAELLQSRGLQQATTGAAASSKADAAAAAAAPHAGEAQQQQQRVCCGDSAGSGGSGASTPRTPMPNPPPPQQQQHHSSPDSEPEKRDVGACELLLEEKQPLPPPQQHAC